MNIKKAILISCFDWYEDRLRYIEDYLKDKNYNVSVFVSDFDHIEKAYKKNNNSINYIHVLSYKKNISIRRVLSHICFVKKIEGYLKDADLVYCLIPPNYLSKRLSLLKNKYGYKLVFDIIDLWPESFPKGSTNFLPFCIWRRLRDDYLEYADTVVLECEYYREKLKINDDKIKILHLIKNDINRISSYEPYSEDLCLGYLGSINSLIDIDRICEIIKAITTEKSILVRIVGDGDQKDTFIDCLKKAGAAVKYYGKIYDLDKLQYILGNCKFGINIYKSNIAVGLTIKSVSYFQLGIPIINSIKGDTYNIVKKYNAGINIDDYDINVAAKMICDYSAEYIDVFELLFSSRNVNERLTFLDEII